MKNVSKDSFEDKIDENKLDAEKPEAAEEKAQVLEHENDGVVGNNAEQYEHSVEEPVNPAQPDLSNRPTNDPSVYPSDPNKGLTPNPLPVTPQAQPLRSLAVHRDGDEKMSVEEILTRLLHISNVAHHAGNQFDVKSVGHALKELAYLMHRMISEK